MATEMMSLASLRSEDQDLKVSLHQVLNHINFLLLLLTVVIIYTGHTQKVKKAVFLGTFFFFINFCSCLKSVSEAYVYSPNFLRSCVVAQQNCS